ncbi:MAG: hypothetical protein Q7T24_04760, partial [Deltaproteobacteria bacterium]|nr:hypothetical protein [Deltaproteobacteria bacterium]
VYGEPGILGLQRLSCGGADTTKKTYLPWVVENGRRSLNTPFLRIWDKTVTAFAEFIHSHPLKGRVSYIAITGGPTSNGLEIMWNSNFSSPDLNWDREAEDLFIRFWKGVIDIFIKNFPDIPLGLAFTDIFGSNTLCEPGRNTDIPGQIVNYALKSAEANKAAVVPMGLWLGNISPANLRGHPLVRLMKSFNAPFAYQGHLFTATKEGLQAMLDFAVEERAPWVELWHSDIINDGYAGIIKEARNRLLSAG